MATTSISKDPNRESSFKTFVSKISSSSQSSPSFPPLHPRKEPEDKRKRGNTLTSPKSKPAIDLPLSPVSNPELINELQRMSIKSKANENKEEGQGGAQGVVSRSHESKGEGHDEAKRAHSYGKSRKNKVLPSVAGILIIQYYMNLKNTLYSLILVYTYWSRSLMHQIQWIVYKV